MTDKEICPNCDKGKLTEKTYSDMFRSYAGTFTVNGLLSSHCDYCDQYLINPDQLKRNQELIREVRATHEGRA